MPSKPLHVPLLGAMLDHRPSRMSACTRSTATRPPLPNMREELTTDQPPLLVFGINCEMKEAMEMLT